MLYCASEWRKLGLARALLLVQIAVSTVNTNIMVENREEDDAGVLSSDRLMKAE